MQSEDLFSDILPQQENLVPYQSFFEPNTTLPDLSEILQCEAILETDLKIEDCESSGQKGDEAAFDDFLAEMENNSKNIKNLEKSSEFQTELSKFVSQNSVDHLKLNSVLVDAKIVGGKTIDRSGRILIDSNAGGHLSVGTEVEGDNGEVLHTNGHTADLHLDCLDEQNQILAESSKTAEKEESLQDLVTSLFGNDPDLFTDEKIPPSDPEISLLDEILEEIQPEKNEQDITSVYDQKEELESFASNTVEHLETTAQKKKRFDGRGTFKAKPAFYRSLPDTDDSEVPKQFQLPKQPGTNRYMPHPTKVLVDPRQVGSLQEGSRTQAAHGFNLGTINSRTSTSFRPFATNSIAVNPPTSHSSQHRSGAYTVPNSGESARTHPSAHKSKDSVRRDVSAYKPRPFKKLEALKATFNGQGRIIQDSYTRQLLKKRLMQLNKAKNRQTGYLKILPKGGLNIQQSLLRKNIEQNPQLQGPYSPNMNPQYQYAAGGSGIALGTGTVRINPPQVASKVGLPTLTPWASNRRGTTQGRGTPQVRDSVQVVGPAYTNGTTKVVGPAYTNGTTKVVGPAYTNGTTKAAMNGLHQYPAFSPFQGADSSLDVQDSFLYCQGYQQTQPPIINQQLANYQQQTIHLAPPMNLANQQQTICLAAVNPTNQNQALQLAAVNPTNQHQALQLAAVNPTNQHQALQLATVVATNQHKAIQLTAVNPSNQPLQTVKVSPTNRQLAPVAVQHAAANPPKINGIKLNQSMIDINPWCNKGFYRPKKECQLQGKHHTCNISCQVVNISTELLRYPLVKQVGKPNKAALPDKSKTINGAPSAIVTFDPKTNNNVRSREDLNKLASISVSSKVASAEVAASCVCEECKKDGNTAIYVSGSDEEDETEGANDRADKGRCDGCGKWFTYLKGLSKQDKGVVEKVYSRVLRARKCWNCSTTRCNSWYSHRKRDSTDLCGNCYTHFKSLSKSKAGVQPPTTTTYQTKGSGESRSLQRVLQQENSNAKAEGSKRPGDPAVIDVELEDEDLLDLQDNALNQCQGLKQTSHDAKEIHPLENPEDQASYDRPKDIGEKEKIDSISGVKLEDGEGLSSGSKTEGELRETPVALKVLESKPGTPVALKVLESKSGANPRNTDLDVGERDSTPEGQEAGENVMDGAPPELEDEICLYTNNRLDCLNGSNGGVDVSAGRNTDNVEKGKEPSGGAAVKNPQSPASSNPVCTELLAFNNPESTMASPKNPNSTLSLAPKNPDTTQSLALNSTQSLAPNSTQILGPNSSPSLAPSSSQTLDPNITQTLGPNSTQILGPNSSPSLAPNSTQTLGPNSTQSLAPNSTQLPAPNSTHILGPNSSPSLAPNSSQTLGPNFPGSLKSETSPSPIRGIHDPSASHVEVNLRESSYSGKPKPQAQPEQVMESLNNDESLDFLNIFGTPKRMNPGSSSCDNLDTPGGKAPEILSGHLDALDEAPGDIDASLDTPDGLLGTPCTLDPPGDILGTPCTLDPPGDILGTPCPRNRRVSIQDLNIYD